MYELQEEVQGCMNERLNQGKMAGGLFIMLIMSANHIYK